MTKKTELDDASVPILSRPPSGRVLRFGGPNLEGEQWTWFARGAEVVRCEVGAEFDVDDVPAAVVTYMTSTGRAVVVEK